MTSAPVWILAGVRTPFAKAGGPFRGAPVYELGALSAENAGGGQRPRSAR